MVNIYSCYCHVTGSSGTAKLVDFAAPENRVTPTLQTAGHRNEQTLAQKLLVFVNIHIFPYT